MIPELPDDVLHLVTLELWLDHDFGTLFNCTMSCKRLAVPAVAALYRMHEIAPVTDRGRDADARSSPMELTEKWASLWRSIVLSSAGKTAYPYCHYSRALDLRDLEYLFEDPQFSGGNGKLSRAFFAELYGAGALDEADASAMDELMAKLGSGPATTTAATGRRRQLYERKGDVVRAIGYAVLRKSPLVEELNGTLDEGFGSFLRRCVPLLAKLRRLQLWQGVALAGLGSTIRDRCPQFSTLEFYHWAGGGNFFDESGDGPLATFLGDIRPKSLRSFRITGRSQIGALSLQALSDAHGESLTELKLTDMPAEAVVDLGLLKSCTSLHRLELSDQTGSVNLKAQHADVFDKIVGWLRQCKQLRHIKFTRFVSGAAILTPLFHDSSLHLVELELRSYSKINGPAFYDSLQSQAETLRELFLESEAEENPMRIDTLVEGVCKLRRLRCLDLKKNISEYFRDEHIIVIASSLRQLEVLLLNGWGVTDMIFDSLIGLHSLERFDCHADSEFTFEGLRGYIDSLGEGNRGLQLGVTMANTQSALSEDEQAAIKQLIEDKVGGQFEYTLIRDPDNDDYDESDSD